MDFECPLCNALISVNEKCPRCGNKMQDQGRLEDLLDPYSPYIDTGISAGSEREHQCIHLFICPHCSYHSHIVVNQIPV